MQRSIAKKYAFAGRTIIFKHALKGHIIAIHLNDIAEKNNIKAIDVPLGIGIVNFPEIFDELRRLIFEGYFH